MRRTWLAILGVLLVFPALAHPQVYAVRGQIVMPDGNPPARTLQFHLATDDGRINEYHFTDPSGSFDIPVRPFLVLLFTITVQGDGVTFATTKYTFGRTSGPVRIVLNPFKPDAESKPPAVSAASMYRPKPEALKAHKKALKDLEQRRLPSAEAGLRRAIALDPQFADAYNDLGALLARQQKYAESEKILREGLLADPKSPDILANLGMSLNHLRRFAEALPHLQEASRLAPGMPAVDLHLGIALVESGQLAEAEPALLRASEHQGPLGLAALLYLGQFYARTGEYAKGIAALELLLQKAPEGPNAEAARALLEQLRRKKATRP